MLMAWRNIWRNKRRTLITMASIFFAVFFAILMRAFQLGTYDHMIHQAIESYSGYIQVQNANYFDDPNLDNSFAYNQNLMTTVHQVENIKVAVPRVESFALASTGVQSKGVLVTGIDLEAERALSNPESRLVKYRLSPAIVDEILAKAELKNKQEALLRGVEHKAYSTLERWSQDVGLTLVQEEVLFPLLEHLAAVDGEYLKEDDEGVLVSDRLAQFLKAEVGDTIVLMGAGYHGVSAANTFPVRGIVKLLSPDLDNKLVYMTLAQAQYFYALGDNITSLNINLLESDKMLETQGQIASVIDNERFVVKSWEEFNPTMKQQIEGDSVGGVIFIAILYFIVLFGIIGTVLMMVSERKREMGVMVAIGMSKVKLGLVLVFEMLFVGLVATAAGLLGTAPLIVLGHYYPIKMTGEMGKMYEDMGFDPVMPLAWFDNYYVWQGLIILLMVLLACVIPLRRVRKMKVMSALRA